MPERGFIILADAVLLTHVLIVLFVLVGLITTLLGRILNWLWVRNPWFRSAHLLCIGVVVAQAWGGVICPLTTFEMWLRERGGGEVYAGSFIAYWLDKLLYYDFPTWVFTLAYSLFAGLVVVSWFWVRPLPFKAKGN